MIKQAKVLKNIFNSKMRRVFRKVDVAYGKVKRKVLNRTKDTSVHAQKEAVINYKLLWSDIEGQTKKALTIFKNSPWAKKAIIAGAGIVGVNMLHGVVNKMTSRNERVIPPDYDRGYDILTQNLTDFGSPVKLAKAAQKIINPYYSTVRKATYTTTQTITDGNLALKLSKNAINHTRY
jgi:hypothetical protein